MATSLAALPATDKLVRWNAKGTDFLMSSLASRIPAQQKPLDFATGGFGQFFGKLHHPRIGMGGQAFFDVGLQVFGKRVIAFNTVGQHDNRLHNFCALGVGHTDHCGLGDGRVFNQRAFNIERSDPVSG